MLKVMNNDVMNTIYKELHRYATKLMNDEYMWIFQWKYQIRYNYRPAYNGSYRAFSVVYHIMSGVQQKYRLPDKY